MALAFGLPILIGLALRHVQRLAVAWVRLPAADRDARHDVRLSRLHRLVSREPDLPAPGLVPGARPGEDRAVPIPVIILLAVTLVASVVLNRTRFGRYVYAVGGNEDAARASGINVKLVKLGVYSISGFFCGLAGLVFTSRLGAAQSISGMGFELVAIASVVVGGREPVRRPRKRSARRSWALSSCRSFKAGSSCSTCRRRYSRRRSASSSSSRSASTSIVAEPGAATRRCRRRYASFFSVSELKQRREEVMGILQINSTRDRRGVALCPGRHAPVLRPLASARAENGRRHQGEMVADAVQGVEALDHRRVLHRHLDLLYRGAAKGGAGEGQGDGREDHRGRRQERHQRRTRQCRKPASTAHRPAAARRRQPEGFGRVDRGCEQGEGPGRALQHPRGGRATTSPSSVRTRSIPASRWARRSSSSTSRLASRS